MDFGIEASVHTPLGDGYRLKVSIAALGMYINGFRAYPPKGKYDWAVYPPQTRNPKNGRYINLLEFDKKTEFWDEFKRACINAVNDYKSGASDTDEFNIEEELGKALDNLDNTPKAIPWMNDDI